MKKTYSCSIGQNAGCKRGLEKILIKGEQSIGWRRPGRCRGRWCPGHRYTYSRPRWAGHSGAILGLWAPRGSWPCRYMSSTVSILQDLDLPTVIVMLFHSRLTIGQCFIHLAASINYRLHILVHKVLLLQLVDFQVGLEFTLRIDGLCQRCHGIEQNLAGIHHGRTGAVGPAGQSLQTDGGIESGTGSLKIGFCRLQLMLGVARVNHKEFLTPAHMLTFGHKNLHQLTTHLGHNVHIGLTFHLGTKFHRNFDTSFLYCHRFIRWLCLLRDINSTRYHDSGHNE